MEEKKNDEIREHFDSLCRQAEELKKEFPGFELSEALKDADFVKLTAPRTGTDLRRAFYALNRESLDAAAEQRGAENARRALSESLAANAARPRESAGRHSPGNLQTDYRNLSGGARQELKKRIRNAAARGEKIFP